LTNCATHWSKKAFASDGRRFGAFFWRAAWRAGQPQLNPSRLVFIDEIWATTNMARRFGRYPRGQRLVAAIPHGHWKTSTFVAGLRATGLSAPFVVDGAINGEIFRAYVEQMLAPTLEPGDVVVMDNLSSHKVAGVREAIAARSRETLWTTIGDLLPRFSNTECANYLADASYVPPNRNPLDCHDTGPSRLGGGPSRTRASQETSSRSTPFLRLLMVRPPLS